jgi:alpha-glucosidase
VWRERLPWAYGNEIEAICRRYLELRYRLMPYTYTLAWQAHQVAASADADARPETMPSDPRTWQLRTEYLWGDDLLVARDARRAPPIGRYILPKGRLARILDARSS